MKRLRIKLSLSYFFIHWLVELLCFWVLYSHYETRHVWIVAFMYDALAFVPQGIIGEFMNRHKKFDLGTLGVILMALSLSIFKMGGVGMSIAGVICLGLGNACLHICGAISTVSVSEGKLFPTALFVGGGSFGVITGQLLGKNGLGVWWIISCFVILEVLVLWTNNDWLKSDVAFPEFKLCRESCPASVVIVVAIAVTAVRSMMGYAIPTAWNKTTWQAVFMFAMMGLGKALGGLASDIWGARKTGLVTTLLAVPFLVWGNNLMAVSIVGIFLFSMTMSITFGMLLSVIKDDPGLAFGGTTLGLFLGVVPTAVWGSFSLTVNIILVVALSILCFGGFYKTLKK